MRRVLVRQPFDVVASDIRTAQQGTPQESLSLEELLGRTLRPRPTSISVMTREGSFSIGDLVTLGWHGVVNGYANWITAMDAYAGYDARITSLPGHDHAGCEIARVDIDQGQHKWRTRNLLLVAKDKALAIRARFSETEGDLPAGDLQ